jgi:hypothetical protein
MGFCRMSTVSRFMSRSRSIGLSNVPLRGQTRGRQVWKAYIRSKREHLPDRGSSDEKYDEKVRQQTSKTCTRSVRGGDRALFREMKTVEHSITLAV